MGETFGSTVQCVALQSSDVDVRMSFEQFTVQDKVRQIHYLKGIAAAPGEDFSHVDLIEARVPVLRLRFRDQLDVDLTMGNELEGGREVDDVVSQLLNAGADQGVRRFVRLVKVFAKAHKLVNAFNGFLNSISWVCIVINFLQKQQCLPSFLQIKEDMKQELCPVVLAPVMLGRFFAYFEKCGKQKQRVSVFEATCRVERGTPWPVFVENPCAR